MKELAMVLNKIEDLELTKNPFRLQEYYNDNDFMKELKLAQESVKDIIGKKEVSRVYYGSEFCEYLLPSIENLTKVLEKSDDYNLKLTLVTPIVTEQGIKKVERILNFLSENSPNAEVVFNDWGVLNLINEKYSNLTCVSGRMINKMFKDPRYTIYDLEKYTTEEGMNFIKSPSITSKSFQKLLRSYNVNRVDFDPVMQGIQFIKDEIPFSTSLYVPYGYITTGTNCMMRALTRSEDMKFVQEDRKCEKRCLEIDQIMFKQIEPIRNEFCKEKPGYIKLFRKGNTIFYLNNLIEKIYDLNQFDRIIYQPTVSL